MVAAAKAVGIDVLDQFILGNSSVCSLHSGRVLIFSATDRVAGMSFESIFIESDAFPF